MVVILLENETQADVTFGFTSSIDALTIENVANITLKLNSDHGKNSGNSGKFSFGTKAEMEFVYDILTKEYTLSKDVAVVASGTAKDAVTGIYLSCQKGAVYVNSNIGNLTIQYIAEAAETLETFAE